jgi:hypothetical protein
MNDRTTPLGLRVASVQTLALYLNDEVKDPAYEDSTLNLGLKFMSDIENETCSFTVEASFHAKDEPSVLLVSGKVRTEYKVENLKALEVDNEVSIPDNAMITMLSIAISHLRAILAQHTSGTNFSNIILPIVNPAEIYTNFLQKTIS